MAYYSTHGISQFLLNNEKQRVRFLLAHPVQHHEDRRYWVHSEDREAKPSKVKANNVNVNLYSASLQKAPLMLAPYHCAAL